MSKSLKARYSRPNLGHNHSNIQPQKESMVASLQKIYIYIYMWYIYIYMYILSRHALPLTMSKVRQWDLQLEPLMGLTGDVVDGRNLHHPEFQKYGRFPSQQYIGLMYCVFCSI